MGLKHNAMYVLPLMAYTPIACFMPKSRSQNFHKPGYALISKEKSPLRRTIQNVWLEEGGGRFEMKSLSKVLDMMTVTSGAL